MCHLSHIHSVVLTKLHIVAGDIWVTAACESHRHASQNGDRNGCFSSVLPTHWTINDVEKFMICAITCGRNQCINSNWSKRSTWSTWSRSIVEITRDGGGQERWWQWWLWEWTGGFLWIKLLPWQRRRASNIINCSAVKILYTLFIVSVRGGSNAHIKIHLPSDIWRIQISE